MATRYLKKLEGTDDEKLESILGWLNDGYARKLWQQKTGKSKKRVNRTDMRALHDLVCEILDARGTEYSREPQRNGDYTMLFGMSMANVDMPLLCEQLRDYFEADLAGVAAGMEERVKRSDQERDAFLSAWLRTRLSTKDKQVRKLSNQLLSRMLYINPDWRDRYESHDRSVSPQWPPDYLLNGAPTFPEPFETLNELMTSMRDFIRWTEDDECLLPRKEDAANRVRSLLP